MAAEENAQARVGGRSYRGYLALLCIAAGFFYLFRLGHNSLGSSEAYTAHIACGGDFGSVVNSTLLYDPGKPPLYHLLLHYYTAIFGCGEIGLRSFSAIFGILDVLLIFATGTEFFSAEIGLAAAALWAFNPLAVVLARWARMYSMLIGLVAGHLIMFCRARRTGKPSSTAAAALLGAAMLYTHLASAIILAAEAAIVTRDLAHRRKSRASAAVIAGALLLFTPYGRIAASQSHSLLFGHWLDWIGRPHASAGFSGLIIVALASVALLVLIFGRNVERDDLEPIRVIAIWVAIPIAAFAIGSILVRPMFEVRYLAPVFAIASILIARMFSAAGARPLRIATVGAATAFAVMFSFYQVTEEPWRQMAGAVSSSGSREPVFFEAGFFLSESQTESDLRSGFEHGFFRVPFDYYCGAANPRAAIDPFKTDDARSQISRAVNSFGGAWLVSGRSEELARAEMPQDSRYPVTRVIDAPNARLYRIGPPRIVSR